MNTLALIKQAKRYRDHGLSPIPKKRGAKHPTVRWKSLRSTEITDALMSEWFAAKSVDGVCLLTGDTNGIFVVDLDVKDGVNGIESLKKIMSEKKNKLPKTWVVESGGGKGLHIYFKYPANRQIKSQVAIRPGIDIRSNGGLIVAPPSVHPETRKLYQWKCGCSPDECVLAEAPEWLLSLLTETAESNVPIPKVDENGRSIDGRERIMAGVVWRVICEAARDSDVRPTCDEIFERAWREYKTKVVPRGKSLEADGRGESAMRKKIEYALRDEKWEEATKQCSLVMRGSPPQVVNNLANTEALLNMSDVGSALAFDQRSAKTMLMSQPTDVHISAERFPRNMTENDLAAIRVWMERNTLLKSVSEMSVLTSLNHIARRNSFDPVVDYLKGLAWDGNKRIDDSVKSILHCDDSSPYSVTVWRMFLIGAVARAFNPGCKADHMLILEGPQGCGKSTVCSVLGGEYFSDSLPTDLNNKDALLHLIGPWIIEIAEMASLRHRDQNILKGVLSRQVDTFRAPYAKAEETHPRRFIFIGTTNESQYLKDPSGNRRYWPLKVKDINIDDLKLIRDQLFAEAVAAFRAGEKWFPDLEFEQKWIAPQQENRREEDPWEEKIRVFLSKKTETTFNEVREALVLSVAGRSYQDNKRISEILTREGWINTRSGNRRIWIKKSAYAGQPKSPHSSH